MPKLLIIEDKPNLLETLKIALEDEHEVRGALSAEQGFLCLLNWQPDVVIMCRAWMVWRHWKDYGYSPGR